uniref:Uncharacterized protein n=1 Tax=Trypanosoma congolense (strain IL3000) TaxID=1068625 RepID=G0UMV8_TRYCI|nr:hypothetical protein, unlikely [Trypanosoma congolense IL3000]
MISDTPHFSAIFSWWFALKAIPFFLFLFSSFFSCALRTCTKNFEILVLFSCCKKKNPLLFEISCDASRLFSNHMYLLTFCVRRVSGRACEWAVGHSVVMLLR